MRTNKASPRFFNYLLSSKKKSSIAKNRSKIIAPFYSKISDRPIACAWLDPYDFFAHEDSQQKLTKNSPSSSDPLTIKQHVENLALARGIKIIYEAQFNVLWFECIPEWYLSPHGLRKEQKYEYVTRLKKIMVALKRIYAKKKLPLPKIFIGFNITSNFKSYPVINPVQSITGTIYTKIPSPFDISNFWKPEVLDVFDTFITECASWVPIDGIFFDLEMYHAPEQTGAYTDFMDFSDTAWNAYCMHTDNTEASSIKTIKNRFYYLQKKRKFNEYFSALEYISRKIAAYIKQYMRKKLPHLLFAVYTPTLPLSWFYRGFISGLSSPSEPLLLATFNTDYASHVQWLAHHRIFCVHGTAIMLSKLHIPSDFALIQKQLMYHDFVWYNRPSRMIYQYNQEELNKTWWAIEASPALATNVMLNIKEAHIPWSER